MSRAIKTAGAILTLGIFLAAFNLGGSAGCGAVRGATGADDDTVTATETEAAGAYDVASEAISAALTASGAALTVQGGLKLAQVVDNSKNTITYADASSCSEGNVPSPSGNPVTIDGATDISPNWSGSAAVSWDETADTFDILIAFDNLSNGTYSLDGDLGFMLTSDGNTGFSLDLGSQDLTAGFDGNTCSAVFNIGLDVVVGDTSTTTTLSGCAGICGEYFTVSGTDTINF